MRGDVIPAEAGIFMLVLHLSKTVSIKEHLLMWGITGVVSRLNETNISAIFEIRTEAG